MGQDVPRTSAILAVTLMATSASAQPSDSTVTADPSHQLRAFSLL